MCPHCADEWESEEDACTNKVWVKLSANVANESIDWDNSSYEMRCQNCFHEDAAYISMFDLHVDVNIAIWSSYWEEYFLSSDFTECENCGEIHPWNAGDDIWVYVNPINDDDQTGCLSCWNGQYVTDESTSRLVVKSSTYLLKVTGKQLISIGDTGFEYIDAPTIYTSTLEDPVLCPTFFKVFTNPDDEEVSYSLGKCEGCTGEGCNVILNGTPLSLNIPSLI
jgi:hypothetical protein